MGGEPYYYIVPYEADIGGALQKLRRREFEAGRYNPVTPMPRFPVDPAQRGPGARHASIEEALNDSDADGTRSILDLRAIGDTPDFFVAARLPDETLMEVCGTARPTRSLAKEQHYFLDHAERGQGIYVILYNNGEPDEILFAGYSFD